MPAPVLPTTVFFDLGDTLTFTDANNQRQLYPDVLDTLQILRERGYRLGLLSNQASGTTVAQVNTLLASLNLAGFIAFDLITISSEIAGNQGKPARPIFDLALQKAGHPAASNQSIFVTETADHIQAARSYGWRAILKRNAGICQPSEGECVASLSGLLGLLPRLANLAGTNLQLAPPAKLVDGLWAVPIDIQRITATLSFDGATNTGSGDATLEFRMGHQAGNPIFDLRQTITAAWLDGAPLPVAQLSHHDFGGGVQAELRVVEALLAAGSNHNLRVTYTLGPPQASTAGSYQPAITWSSGPRLAFNFGFTDLGAGRYLEAWVPANLIFDQFELVLDLRLLNTTVAHSVITNGVVTSLGANHWRVNFPTRFTALSPLLELRASNSLTTATSSVSLPVSGANITIEAWKLASSSVNLSTQIDNIKTYLVDNETSTGSYLHGNRFVAFLHLGGMEYEGGTTTGTGALRHETFHSWWARGLKPASQPDAWFDEAWTVYNDHGASEAQPFSFTDPPVTLCPPNPWVRVTAAGAYSDGYRFWKGVAALVGVGTLRALMSEFYQARRHRPVSTTEIEEFLICRTGNPQLVDAFHRFVFGFANPTAAPDLWLRDDPADAGADFWPGRFWDSPDLWARNADDGGTLHQAPEFGQDNWFYARVRNRSSITVRHFVLTFNVKEFAGTQFVYPNDFLPCVAAASGFELAPGASVIVKARWPRSLVPLPGNHACLLASVLTRSDQPVASRHVWEHNNLAQKNLTIVDLAPNEWFVLPFVAANPRLLAARSFRLELVRPGRYPGLEAGLMHPSKAVFGSAAGLRLEPYAHSVTPAIGDAQMDCGGHGLSRQVGADAVHGAELLSSSRPELLGSRFVKGVKALFAKGERSEISVLIRSQEQLVFGLWLRVPAEAKKGEMLHLDVIQRDPRVKRILGGIAVRINVR